MRSSFVENAGRVALEEKKDGALMEQGVRFCTNLESDFCTNLESDFYVSPIGNELVPTQVLTARVRKNPSQKGRYEYQLQPCQNSNRLPENRSLDGKRD